MKLRELSDCAKMCGATYVMMKGIFNEMVCSPNLQNFMNETGMFDVYQEINSSEPEQRVATFECRSVCFDHMLTTERVVRRMTGIKLIDCSEIFESDNRGYLNNVNFVDYFAEELVKYIINFV